MAVYICLVACHRYIYKHYGYPFLKSWVNRAHNEYKSTNLLSLEYDLTM